MFKNSRWLSIRPLKSAFDYKNTWVLFTAMRYNTVFTGATVVNETGTPEHEGFYKPSGKAFSPRRNYYFFNNALFA